MAAKFIQRPIPALPDESAQEHIYESAMYNNPAFGAANLPSDDYHNPDDCCR